MFSMPPFLSARALRVNLGGRQNASGARIGACCDRNRRRAIEA
jgi:hypothetical protein